MERILALFLESRIIAEVLPVASLNCLLLFLLCNAHAALDAVVDAGSIRNDEGRAVVAFCSVIALMHWL